MRPRPDRPAPRTHPDSTSCSAETAAVAALRSCSRHVSMCRLWRSPGGSVRAWSVACRTQVVMSRKARARTCMRPNGIQRCELNREYDGFGSALTESSDRKRGLGVLRCVRHNAAGVNASRRCADLAHCIPAQPAIAAIQRIPSRATSCGTSWRPSNSRNVTSYPIDRSLGTMTRLHDSMGRI